MSILKGVRPLDYLLTAVMAAIAVWIGLANVHAGPDADVAHRLDSHSVLLVPVFVVSALPILWRRRSILGAVAVSFVVMALSVPAFGWVTRCGFALPLSIAMAYAVARFAGSRQNQVVGLVGILALQVAALVEDASTGGLNALDIAVPLAAVAYGIGWYVERRTHATADAPTLTLEHAQA